MIKDNLIQIIHEMEDVTKLFKLKSENENNIN